MMFQEVTLRQQILGQLRRRPSQSATEIARSIKRSAASISSLLVTLRETGIVEITDGRGPRGGKTYKVVAREPHSSRRAVSTY